MQELEKNLDPEDRKNFGMVSKDPPYKNSKLLVNFDTIRSVFFKESKLSYFMSLSFVGHQGPRLGFVHGVVRVRGSPLCDEVQPDHHRSEPQEGENPLSRSSSPGLHPRLCGAFLPLPLRSIRSDGN